MKFHRKENSLDEQKPSIGRLVHYVLESGPCTGQHRPALIVRVWGDLPTSAVQLQVFTDSPTSEDSNDCLPPVMWATSRLQDASGEKPGTWHWPERV